MLLWVQEKDSLMNYSFARFSDIIVFLFQKHGASADEFRAFEIIVHVVVSHRWDDGPISSKYRRFREYVIALSFGLCQLCLGL